MDIAVFKDSKFSLLEDGQFKFKMDWCRKKGQHTKINSPAVSMQMDFQNGHQMVPEAVADEL